MWLAELEKLFVQMHHHRAEHWIMVSGSATVTIDDKTTLERIEAQSGAYLGENDIVRCSDRYGRVEKK